MLRRHATRFLVALSAANLMFIRQWSDLLNAKPGESYYENLAAYPASVLAVYASVALAGVALWAVLEAGKRLGYPRLGYLFFLPPAFFFANGLRLTLNDERFSLGYLVVLFGKGTVLIVLSLILGGVAYLFWKKKTLSFAVLDRGLLVLALMLPLNVVRTLPILLAKTDRAPRTLVTSDRIAPQRVFWMVFDGMDYRASFPDRPFELELPNLDALRAESVFHTHALAPGSETSRSMPGYLMGREVSRALLPDRAGEFNLQFEAGKEEAWAKNKTVFAQAKTMGALSAVVGWHLPYCELLGESVDVCRRYPHYDAKKEPYDDLFFPSVASVWREVVHVSWRDTQVHAANYHRILRDALEFVEDKSLDLVFVHWPIPHNPIIFDSGRVRDDIPNYLEGHFENLKLADRALGAVMEKLRATGQWEEAAVIVTSDHPSRAVFLRDQIEDPRIPLLIKEPGTRNAREVSRPTQAAGIATRVLEFLGGSSELASAR